MRKAQDGPKNANIYSRFNDLQEETSPVMDCSDQEYDGVLAGILDKGERERTYIGIRTYMESTFIDLRVYYQAEDDWKPTKREVTLPVTSFKDLYDTVVDLGNQLGFTMPTPSAGTDESQTAQELSTATPQAEREGSESMSSYP